MSLLTNKRVLLAKSEVTYGVDPTPTGSANAMLVRNLTINPLQGDKVSRDLIRPYFGNSEELIASKFVQIEFEVELQGSGAAGTAPAYAPLLKACGLSETIDAGVAVTYEPVSSGFGSVTLYYNVDGLLHKITGARGTFELSLAVKQIPVYKFTFIGIYNDPSDTAAPSPDFSNFLTPELVNTQNTPGFTVHGYNGIAESVSFNLANDVQYLTYVGSESVKVLDRKPAGTLVVEAPAIATKDFFSIASDNTKDEMEIVHGTVAGKIITITMPKVSIGQPSYQDSNGVQFLSLPYIANPDVGNDELSIVYS